MDAREAILTRYACMQYSDEQITEEQIKALIEAANAAPVGMGDYSGYELIVVQDEEIRKAIDGGTALGLASVYIMAVPTVMQGKPELLEKLEMSEGFIPVVLVSVGKAKNEKFAEKKNRLRSTVL